MATITQLTALSIVHEFISSDPDMLLPICDKYSCSPDDIIDNIKHQIDMRQKNGAKTSNAPSKVRIQNLNTVNSVVVPFVNNASDVVTAKVLANGAGSPARRSSTSILKRTPPRNPDLPEGSEASGAGLQRRPDWSRQVRQHLPLRQHRLWLWRLRGEAGEGEGSSQGSSQAEGGQGGLVNLHQLSGTLVNLGYLFCAAKVNQG